MDSDPPPLSRSFAPLSQRERDILALLAKGLSDREIADRLFLAYTTVKWHNRQIFNKLGVDSRQQAVERATAGGLQPTRVPSPAASTRKLPAALTPFIGRLGKRDKALIAFLADTGCRAGGICGLLMEDLDFEHGKAYVIEKGSKRRAIWFEETTAFFLADWLKLRRSDLQPSFTTTKAMHSRRAAWNRCCVS